MSKFRSRDHIKYPKEKNKDLQNCMAMQLIPVIEATIYAASLDQLIQHTL